MIELLSYVVLGILALFLVAFLFTLFVFRRDKYFTLALIFAEIGAFLAFGEFGPKFVVSTAITIGETHANVNVNDGTQDGSFLPLIALAICAGASVVFMVLRFWDSRSDRRVEPKRQVIGVKYGQK